MNQDQSKTDGRSSGAPKQRKSDERVPSQAGPAFTARSAIACLLAWLIPGAGHLYLARVRRAIIFFAAIMILFVGGILLDGKIYQPQEGQFLSYLATFACMGHGPSLLMMKLHPLEGNIRSADFEYGTTFILAAGLLNMLLILDAYDISINRKG